MLENNTDFKKRKACSQLKSICRSAICSLLILTSVSVWAAGFNDNGDGTVTDFATGLTWQQSSTHNSTGRSWTEAVAYCDALSLAGKNDWRLPKIKELSSIVDQRRTLPTIDLTVFPGTLSSSLYWSASTFAEPGSSAAWAVFFNVGSVAGGSMAIIDGHVRCVR